MIIILFRTCLLLWWSENTKHLSYCGGVEVQNMSPTVVEWNTEHVTYYGGVEIQNMSPTVMEDMFCISTPPQ
jgi:hypothetical protein